MKTPAFGVLLCIPPPPQPGWTPTVAAGGVCGAGGVTEPTQPSSSPTDQLCQLGPCGDREGGCGAQLGVKLEPCVCVCVCVCVCGVCVCVCVGGGYLGFSFGLAF